MHYELMNASEFKCILMVCVWKDSMRAVL
uniref:Uncharacterized protein n=1 Tax=Arundo donax TaxID=35708 RepID=A0A0A9CF65_ARUDO